VKPGAERGQNILPEPPTESEGPECARVGRLVGSAGSARYSGESGPDSARAIPDKQGGTARASLWCSRPCRALRAP
jgi:hypothetical protein